MRSLSTFARRGILTLTVLALLAPRAIAQEKDAPTVSFEGAEVFCHILHSLRLQPITDIAEIANDPSQSIIIILGNPRILKEAAWPMDLEEFSHRGGNVLIATDYEYRGFDVRVLGNKILQAEAIDAFGRDVRCPFLPYESIGLAPGEVREHPLFIGLNQGIATNCPSHLRFVDSRGALSYLLDFPKDVDPEPPLRGNPQERRNRRTLHRKGYGYMIGSRRFAPPGGRILIIAGHGIFMNGMMLQPDTDNFAFANNAVRWLQESWLGQTRTRALLIVDGAIVDDFNTNLAPPLPPIPLPTARMFNRLLRGLEDERFLQRLLEHALDGNWNRLLAILLGITTVALVLYGAKKLLQGRHAPEASVPSMAGAPVAIDVAGPVQAQRRQAALRRRDYGTAASALLRDWLQAEFSLPLEQLRMAGRADFALHAASLSWSRWRLRAQGKLVLRLVGTSDPLRLSRREFFQLIDALQNLSRALRDGRATLLIAGKTVRHT